MFFENFTLTEVAVSGGKIRLRHGGDAGLVREVFLIIPSLSALPPPRAGEGGEGRS